MKFPVYSITGQETGREVEVPDNVFSIEPNEHVMYLDIKRYLASLHRGTHKTKTRGEVQGSTRKIRPQKHTGQARAGQRTSPIFRGGGRVFGPQPRDYSIKLNKKMQNLARRSALSAQAANNAIKVVEDFSIEIPKTKEIIKILEALNASKRFTLLVLPEPNRNIYLSARNLPYVEVLPYYSLNTYIIVRPYTLLFTEKAILKTADWLSPSKSVSHETA
ncbi:MAG: 50S ribosomal protein L4 [Chlorobi bacterium]|nr:50S ribosomal protein L4 [Chlorobiota bacterium]